MGYFLFQHQVTLLPARILPIKKDDVEDCCFRLSSSIQHLSFEGYLLNMIWRSSVGANT